ncbi:MAG: serine hydrolase, partial [Clostridia bacterium]|nr:serine hydrolase [Clostridia bacterium]
MKEIYRFTESSAAYASFMKETMMSSAHTITIGYGVSPKKIAHKYGWDTDAYHDMAIVYDEHPYVLVVMSDMDAGGEAVNQYVQKVVRLLDDLHENFYQ